MNWYSQNLSRHLGILGHPKQPQPKLYAVVCCEINALGRTIKTRPGKLVSLKIYRRKFTKHFISKDTIFKALPFRNAEKSKHRNEFSKETNIHDDVSLVSKCGPALIRGRRVNIRIISSTHGMSHPQLSITDG